MDIQEIVNEQTAELNERNLNNFKHAVRDKLLAISHHVQKIKYHEATIEGLKKELREMKHVDMDNITL